MQNFKERRKKEEGLPFFAQKTLLAQVESSGGLDHYHNLKGEKKQLIKPLLDKFPNLFGDIGNPKRKQARDVIKYWYKHFYEQGKYSELLSQFEITPFLESSIPSTGRTLSSSTKTASTSNKK